MVCWILLVQTTINTPKTSGRLSGNRQKKNGQLKNRRGLVRTKTEIKAVEARHFKIGVLVLLKYTT